MTPRASIVIPVFQDPDGLRACLDGLARQSMPRDQFEVIVVDNGSTPPLEVRHDDLPHLVLLRCMTPGSYAARNAGALAARGTYLVFTDADCVPREHWLQSGIKSLEQAGRDAIAGGEVLFSRPRRHTMVSLYQMAAGFQQAQNIAHKGFSATANVFCRRETFQRVGPFAETLLSGGDREWAWRARRMGIETIFAAEAIVETAPRASLRGAARQARRVAAGRYHLRRSGRAADRLESLQPHRSVVSSFFWIATNRELRWHERLRVLVAATLLKAVSALETVRVRLGGQAERR